LPDLKNKKKYEKIAMDLVVSYKRLSNLHKDLAKLQSSEIKEIRKMILNTKKLLDNSNLPKKELNTFRIALNKEYKKHLTKINSLFK